MEFIDLKQQYNLYKEEIDKRVQQVFDQCHFIMGPEVEEIESTLSSFVGAKHCITVASGTDSLEIALRALSVGPGDEVITVPFSWISSAEVIELVGAKPVFVDIEPDGYLLDPNLLEAAITPNTKAIIPVSLYGQMPDLEAIEKIASQRGIPVIEDAAQSFGATQRGARSCSVTKVSSTSFFPAKPLGCFGDGGALFTDEDHLAESMRAIRTHGGVKRHHHTLVGMNGRFDTVQAAVLLAKFPHFSAELEARNKVAAMYEKALTDVCSTPKVMQNNSHVYAQYIVRVPEEQRAEIQSKMKTDGIPTAVYYPKCFHEQPVFAPLGYKWGDFPVSEKASREVLGLPMHPFLKEEEVKAICTSLKKTLQH